MTATRIVLVEDDREVRWHFGSLISAEADFEMVAEFGDATSALAYVAAHPIDVLLVDLGLPDRDGIEVVRLCAKLQPNSERVVVTVFGDDARLFASLEAGATGYVLKDDMPSDIVACVRMVRDGGSPVSPSIARRLLGRFAARRQAPGYAAPTVVPTAAPATTSAATSAAVPDGPPATGGENLSPREVEILSLIAKGPSIAEIAALLQLSPDTVGTHVKNIYRKLAVHTRTEAVFEGRSLGLLSR